MSEVLQANVFFVITSIAVVVVTVLVCFVLWYLIKILRNVREITDRLRRGSEQLAEDANAVRVFVHEGIVGTLLQFVGKIIGKTSPKADDKRPVEKKESRK